MKVLWLILALTIPAAAFAQSDELIHNPMGYGVKQRPGVFFPHSRHISDLDCTACHHGAEDGRKTAEVEDLSPDNPNIRCIACHATGKTSAPLMQAFHRQCIGCHRETARTGRPSGPQECGICHAKS